MAAQAEPGVYLLIEREFLRLRQGLHGPVVKVGRTKKPISQRLHGYPKGSRLLAYVGVSDDCAAEAAILAVFRAAFLPRPDIGREYFAACDSLDKLLTTFLAAASPFAALPALESDAASTSQVPDEEEDEVPDEEEEELQEEAAETAGPVRTRIGWITDPDELVHEFYVAHQAELAGATVPMARVAELFKTHAAARGALSRDLSWAQLLGRLKRFVGALEVTGAGGLAVAFPALPTLPAPLPSVQDFLHLTQESPGAVVGEYAVFPRRTPGTAIAIRAVHDALKAFIRSRASHNGRTPSYNAHAVEAALHRAGFSVSSGVNVCRACDRHVRGGRCCNAYDCSRRVKAKVLEGLDIIRIPL